MSFANILRKLESNLDLNKDDLSIIIRNFEKKSLTEEEIKNLVTAWRNKGESSSELLELANQINNKQNQIELDKEAVDVCGTGGDKTNTFNISTLSAIVASSCGVKVIKHSGRSTTSVSGSVDILSQFGYEIDVSNNIKENCFKQTGLLFVSSKTLREIFGSVKPICTKLNIPGFINLLGPLTNPYITHYHLLGVSNLSWGDLIASILKNQNKEALVVCCEIDKNIYMDEFSFCGENYIWKISNDEIKKEILNSKDFQKEIVNIKELSIKNISESKSIFEDILKGKLYNEKTKENEPKSDVVALNSGAILYLTKKVKSIQDGYNLSLKHIQSGKAWEHFQEFITSIKMR